MSGLIVVGVDGSPTASKAAQVAADLAGATGARLHVVCAYAHERVEEIQEGTDHWLLTTADEANETARTVAEGLTLRPGVEVHVAGIPGKAGQALVKEAETLGATLIVVGNKRVQGLARILGSVATDVVHHAPCDVYIAHTA
jgi:nucleotide-binding universal stress UspA family protein